MASIVNPVVTRREDKDEESREEVGDRGRKGEEDVCNDQELDDLLDFSLGEFGKHVPTTVTTPATAPPPPHPQSSSSEAAASGGGAEPNASAMQEFEDVFSEEFVAQAQAKLEEAMQVLSKEDPELWRQLKSFSDAATGGFQPGGRDGEGEEEKEGGGGSIEETLEETLRKLKESTEKIEAEGGLGEEDGDLPATLLKMMEEMKTEGDEEGDWGEDKEEALVNMMDKFMGSFLFSKDVLYPFLTHTCKQYEEWLPGQREKLSSEDYTRYTKQLEVMKEMCHEFETTTDEEEGGEGGGGATGGGRGRGRGGGDKQNEKITELMHQLQQYGQPPSDIMGDENNMMPPSLLPGAPSIPSDCSLM